MKKTRFIAVALVVAVMLMGAGYAYWSDTLTIENTVKTGEFDLEFQFPGGDDGVTYNNGTCYADYVNYQSPSNTSPGGESGINIVNDKNTLEFMFTNYYPGAGAYCRFRIVNTGTVPATLKSLVRDNVDGSEILDEALQYHVKKIVIKRADGTEETVLDELQAYANSTAFVDGLSTELQGTTLYEGDYIEINGDYPNGAPLSPDGYDISLPTTADHTTEELSFGFDITMSWTQWNDTSLDD